MRNPLDKEEQILAEALENYGEYPPKAAGIMFQLRALGYTLAPLPTEEIVAQ